jgi:hypothetical protein
MVTMPATVIVGSALRSNGCSERYSEQIPSDAPTISLLRSINRHGEKGKCLSIAWAMPHILILILFLILILVRKRENCEPLAPIALWKERQGVS